MMSVGGGGYGGGGLPYPSEVLQLWGGAMHRRTIPTPEAPTVVKDDRSENTTMRSSRSVLRAVARTPSAPAGPTDSRHSGGTASRGGLLRRRPRWEGA